MKNFLKIIFIFLLLFSFGTTTCYAKKAIEKKTALELREIQTHTFETSNEKLVMKAVVNTLQDNGFIIQNIEPDLGYIKAKKEVKLKRTLKGRVVAYSFLELYYAACVGLSFGINPMGIWGMWQTGMQIKNEIAPHTVIFDSNIDIQKLGKNTKVRFMVIEKVLENGDGYTTVKSSPRKVVRHYEEKLYQEFFNQVDKNLFLEKI